MAGRLFGWATQFLPLPRAPSVAPHLGGYINVQGYYPWVKICSTENFSPTLAELNFEYPTIKSLRAPNKNAIVLKNSNHNNRQSLIWKGSMKISMYPATSSLIKKNYYQKGPWKSRCTCNSNAFFSNGPWICPCS